jgi:hypothetical protein
MTSAGALIALAFIRNNSLEQKPPDRAVAVGARKHPGRRACARRPRMQPAES